MIYRYQPSSRVEPPPQPHHTLFIAIIQTYGPIQYLLVFTQQVYYSYEL